MSGLCRMFGFLDKVYLSLGKPDVRLWKPDFKGEFSVKSLYSFLIDNSSVSDGWRCFWDCFIPPRVLVFCWLARRGKFLTIDGLRWRNYLIVNGCPMCLRDEEAVNHLLIIVILLIMFGWLFLLGLICSGLCLGQLHNFSINGPFDAILLVVGSYGSVCYMQLVGRYD
eukprot:TRINITY_DN9561_c0_g1_i2.p1 TRINITY_DN9561_c0_g1~~TRINITY_DN9561_c0_g1_i2.p1  ORF type:complete len:168 (-),score=9.92 TRINITY_DN9561_c0_g1_i2:179-682(-)